MASAEAGGAPSAASAADGAAPRFASVAAYVRALGGHSPVRKVLIANNGIAVRHSCCRATTNTRPGIVCCPPAPQPATRAPLSSRPIQAVKCIRSIRRWAYDTFGNEREVRAALSCFSCSFPPLCAAWHRAGAAPTAPGCPPLARRSPLR